MHIIKPPGTDLQNSLSSLTHLGTDNDAFVSFLFQAEDKGDSTANKQQTPSKPLKPNIALRTLFLFQYFFIPVFEGGVRQSQSTF